ncbi:MAG: sulfur carrier protein ThiS [Aquificaceae bacterium]
MRIVVNGKDMLFGEQITILGLLEKLELSKEGIAVAVNGEVIPKSKHDSFSLKDGDEVEVVKVVGGG